MRIRGRATQDGTRRYHRRHKDSCAPDHFRSCGSVLISSIGMGTYLGTCDSECDDQVLSAAIRAMNEGVNLFDCAINYRYERAEKTLGHALQDTVTSKINQIQRDELMICSKAGFLPIEHDPATWFVNTYVDDNRFGLGADDLVEGWHCMHPRYLADQIERSRTNLGLETIDVYYLHNPEIQLNALGQKAFRRRLSQAFTALEEARGKGQIGYYGIASWNGFRVGPDNPQHLDLAMIKQLAQQVAGNTQDGLRFIQLPLNLAMLEALLAIQQHNHQSVPILEVARELDLTVITSASICQGRLVGQVPQVLAQALGTHLTSDAQRAIQFARSCPGVTSALVGMKQPQHVEENLRLVQQNPLSAKEFIQAVGG